MSPKLVHLLREAMKAAHGGEKARAHALFGEITERDPRNEAAWLWYASTAEKPVDALIGIRATLNLNASNPTALAALPQAVFRAGVEAARANDRAAAARLLTEATELDATNEAAWLWRAGVTDDPGTAITFLEQVLKRNPASAQAKAGLAKLRARLGPAPAPPWRCPLCEHSAAADDTVTTTCPGCGAVTALDRPELFDAPAPGVDRALVEAAARRLKAAWTTDPSADTAHALGLAYLNLGYTDFAVRALQAAVQKAAPPGPPWRADAVRFLSAQRETGAGAARAESAPAPAPAPGPKVMVVDDSATVRMMVSSLLTAAGYSVVLAHGAEEASRLVRDSGPPQLFILDINMPGIDGFGLCKFLRATAETATVPVVFLTGKTGLLNKLHGRWVGAADYVTKPFEADKLLETVTRLAPIAKAPPG
ncbi:Alkaline phosphatase synthesis transcriptional regulatory protein SphR [Gemmata obscuriglobus]|uniref:response regulator n=1 Tax=Gemmata obscuriglobus TaxID=114 RepID=UPI0011CCDF77|nr:response regulator [Gemmata obscuriglobus]QEG31820.1 Alkaline phosphatase synthesis transcriptional regulatory protein SphR [Gemmata obscuriglobus]VTS11166.1 pilus response regulator : Response regulator receiver protein OS=Isosphaera pallida (strain ATCC 43644 / DSM 9630 / IS1B) GN=Isop_3686 PE=4 SV=1: Response_reg [Gemmata obscuriglobus UQM 2246]